MPRWSEEQLAQVLNKPVKSAHQVNVESKYRNKRTTDGDHKFDSILERDCWKKLQLMKAAKALKLVLRQPRFDLPGGVIYRSDFLVQTADNVLKVIDATGMMTPVKRMKLKQVLSLYDVDVLIWTSNTLKNFSEC